MPIHGYAKKEKASTDEGEFPSGITLPETETVGCKDDEASTILALARFSQFS